MSELKTESSIESEIELKPNVLSNYTIDEFKALTNNTKGYEKTFESNLNPTQPYIIRLDGCTFKAFTRGLKKPFDERITRAFICTTECLVEKFNACIGFCQSDEITLVFHPNPNNKTDADLLFNGRIQKLCSVVGSFATAKFNGILLNENWDNMAPAIKMKMTGSNAFFDCRVFNVPDHKSAMQVVYWRHHFDCRRNAVNMIGHCHFTHKQLHKVSVRRLIEKLKLEKNIDITSNFNRCDIFGSFSKRVLVNHIGYDPIKKKSVETMRYRVESRVLDMTENESDMINLVMKPTWNEFDKKNINESVT